MLPKDVQQVNDKYHYQWPDIWHCNIWTFQTIEELHNPWMVNLEANPEKLHEMIISILSCMKMCTDQSIFLHLHTIIDLDIGPFGLLSDWCVTVDVVADWYSHVKSLLTRNTTILSSATCLWSSLVFKQKPFITLWLFNQRLLTSLDWKNIQEKQACWKYCFEILFTQSFKKYHKFWI